MTPEQEEALQRMTTFLDTLTDELGGHVEEPEPSEDRASPTGAAKRVARTVIKAEEA